MKKIILTASLLITQFISAQETDIKKSVDTFFEGLHTTDTLKIQSVCDRDIKLQSVRLNTDGSARLVTDEPEKFYKSIASIPKEMKVEEKLLDYKIQIDGPMAHVWTPYEFYINGRLSHKGVNSFQLYNDNGIWKIVYVIDTRRK